jgi:hypothetical protein
MYLLLIIVLVLVVLGLPNSPYPVHAWGYWPSQLPPAEVGGLLLALPAVPGGIDGQPATIGALT